MKNKKLNISYMICATPRTGSFLLCDALSNTKIAGTPKEYLSKRNLLKWQENQNLEDYIQSIFNQSASSNRVRGIKTMLKQFNELREKARKNPDYKNIILNDMHHYLPNTRYIFITRRDKIRQAISYERAIQTSKWRLKENEQYKPKKVIFNLFGIDKNINIIKHDEDAWKSYFKKNKIRPLVIVYEDFIENQDKTIIQVLKFLSIPIPKNLEIKKSNFVKQSDKETDLWIQRYKERRFSDKLLSSYLIIKSTLLWPLYLLSAKIKIKSENYTKLINWIKNG